MMELLQNAKFIGTGVALITPFKKDLTVDTEALKALVNHCIEGGVEYIVALGTTAEAVTLNTEEKLLVRKTIVDETSNRVPLIVGVGGNNTAELVQQLKVDKLDGFDAVLSVSPYYNKPTQEGIYQHFVALADVSEKPIILYNVPSRTGSDMTAETIIRLAKAHSNIIGIKEASGDMGKMEELIQKVPKGFLVISGDDLTALPTVQKGGAGVISVLGQGIPALFSLMIRHGLKGDAEEAREINSSITSMIHLIFKEGNPAGIKTLLELKNIGSSLVRLPLVESSFDLKSEIKTALERLKKKQNRLRSAEEELN